MKTPSHAVLNLALLSCWPGVEGTLPILGGAVLPDLPIFLMYAWAKGICREPEAKIWSKTYYSPFWYTWTTAFHSFPLTVLMTAVSFWLGWTMWGLLSLSMVLHSLGDIPVHNNDAHRHFFPLSQYRLISPFSYWDPKYYGPQVAFIERLCVSVGSLYLWGQTHSGVGKSLLLGLNLFSWGLFSYSWLRKAQG